MGVVQKENCASIIFGIIRHYEHNLQAISLHASNK